MKTIRGLKSALAASVTLTCLLHTLTALADESAPAKEKTQTEEFAGYLKPVELPDAVALLPPPPALGSAAEALDQESSRAALALQGSDRFKLAAVDADLSFPNAAGAFSCALGASVTVENTPALYHLLGRVMMDANGATRPAKDKYRHARPFMLDGEPTCQPSAENDLRKNGSYPSGHTSIGWAWAEVLAEIAPDRANEILVRGRAFGESRVVCNVHWASDVMEGRVIASATVARLRANAEFLADLQSAKREFETARDKGLPPQRDCRFEADALKQTRWLAP